MLPNITIITVLLIWSSVLCILLTISTYMSIRAYKKNVKSSLDIELRYNDIKNKAIEIGELYEKASNEESEMLERLAAATGVLVDVRKEMKMLTDKIEEISTKLDNYNV